MAQARLGVSAEEHERFFRELLGDIDEPTTPFGLREVHRDGSSVEEARRLLAPSLNERLRAQARRLGVSVATLCHVAWGQVVARTSGREQVVFGTVLFGRMHGGAGADRAMGLFINTLPVRLDLDDTGVEASVRQTHALLAELLRHEHASLALAQRCSGVAAGEPLFSALLNYRHSRTPDREATARRRRSGGRGVARRRGAHQLSVRHVGRGLRRGAGLTAQVGEPLSPERVCDFMQRGAGAAGRRARARPDDAGAHARRAAAGRARRCCWRRGTRPEAPYPTERCIHQLFEAQVRQTPDAIAVVQDDVELTYAELNGGPIDSRTG